MPISYVDTRPAATCLSRVTNDIDNLAQSLQQTLSQMLTSSLTLVGVVIMMFLISPLLAMIALITIPVSTFTLKFITKRSKQKFVDQWRHTGTLNAQVEEAFTGHSLVKVFGRQRDFDLRVVPATAHEALDREDGVGGVRDRLALGQLADEALAGLGERDDGRDRAIALRRRDDGGLAALHDRDDGVRGAEVDADDLRHGRSVLLDGVVRVSVLALGSWMRRGASASSVAAASSVPPLATATSAGRMTRSRRR